MAERVVFYQLTHKFVSQEQNIPEGARQVIYYSLAIGHHVGVMDCFQVLADAPLEDYRQWLASFPQGPARLKLEGLLKWGEIELNRSHAPGLLEQLEQGGPVPQAAWTAVLVECLRAMMKEPALYLMVRKAAA